MAIFGKKQKSPEHIPEGFTADDIKIESSICTGERTIGFYSPETKRLMFAELVRGNEDIEAFYAKYGVKAPL